MRASRSSLTVVGLALGGAVCMTAAHTTPPRVARAGELKTMESSAAVTRNEGCARCHAVQWREWTGSLHQRSYDDETYRASLAGEPRAFCDACHGPLASAPRGGALGIGCTGCHTLPADHERRPSQGAAPAQVSAPAKFGVRCEPCHEFRFPRGSELMQHTVREHRASAFASTSCVDCHMPVTGAGAERHHRHDASASRDPALLRRSLLASARLLGPGSLEVTLKTRGVGHAMPTGDMFRRLVVRAEALDGANDVVSRAERVLARRFELRPDGPRETGDDRPSGAAGAEVVVGLDLGEVAPNARVRWRVDYERVVNGFKSPATVAASLTLAGGEVR